jgi:hypothetical protein
MLLYLHTVRYTGVYSTVHINKMYVMCGVLSRSYCRYR